MHERVRRRSRPRAGWPLGRVAGVPVSARPSLAVLAVLVVYVYADVARARLGLTGAAAYAAGAGFVGCLLGSVLLHELGHALTARRFGVGVRGITLELFGGWTELDRDAPSPRIDALVALAGPAVSAVLGTAGAVAAVVLSPRSPGGEVAVQLAASNLVVAVFNVLPGLPLDGGRALRALLWGVLRDRDRATAAAAYAGRGLAVAVLAGGLVLHQARVVTLVGVVFVLLAAGTLWHGAGQSLRLVAMTRRLPLVDLRRLARPVLAVPSGTPLAEAQRRGAVVPGSAPALAVADAAGRLVALVDAAAAARVPPPRRPWVAVDAVARAVSGLARLPVELSGEQVLRRVRAHPGAQYLVTSGEDVVGVLHVGDLTEVLQPRRDGDRRPGPR